LGLGVVESVESRVVGSVGSRVESQRVRESRVVGSVGSVESLGPLGPLGLWVVGSLGLWVVGSKRVYTVAELLPLCKLWISDSIELMQERSSDLGHFPISFLFNHWEYERAKTKFLRIYYNKASDQTIFMIVKQFSEPGLLEVLLMDIKSKQDNTD